MDIEVKKTKERRRKRRTRAKIKGTSERPRLCVFRSSRHIYAQLIDDQKGDTIVAVSDSDLEKKAKSRKGGKAEGKIQAAREVGKKIAEKASKKKIKKAVFDRGPYAYHGRIKALAEGAREGGLEF